MIAAVLQAQKLIMRRINVALSPWGLSFPRYEVLSLVDVAPDGVMSTMRLSRTLERHHTTMISLVDGLEDAGLVTRATNRADRRETLVSITEQGRIVALSAARAVDDAAAADPEVLRCLHTHLRGLLTAGPRITSPGRNASSQRDDDR